MSGFAIENDVSNSRTPPNKKKTQFVPDGRVFSFFFFNITSNYVKIFVYRVLINTLYESSGELSYTPEEENMPVSYTHLDVYKRQVRRIEDAAAPPREQITKNRPRMPLHANKPQSLEAIFALFLPYSA